MEKQTNKILHSKSRKRNTLDDNTFGHFRQDSQAIPKRGKRVNNAAILRENIPGKESKRQTYFRRERELEDSWNSKEASVAGERIESDQRAKWGATVATTVRMAMMGMLSG